MSEKFAWIRCLQTAIFSVENAFNLALHYISPVFHYNGTSTSGIYNYRPRMRKGNVFILSVSVCVFVSVQAITFECLDIETSFLVQWYILTISRSSLSIRVTESRSRSLLYISFLDYWTPNLFAMASLWY